MTGTDDALTHPMPDALHAALQRFSASRARLEAAASRRRDRGGGGDADESAEAAWRTEVQADALARLDRAEQLIRAVAGRLATAPPPAMEEAS